MISCNQHKIINYKKLEFRHSLFRPRLATKMARESEKEISNNYWAHYHVQTVQNDEHLIAGTNCGRRSRFKNESTTIFNQLT